MVCDLPLVSHHNYKNDEDHDQNTRKYWFIVFGVGLFTAQCVFCFFRWGGKELRCVSSQEKTLQAAGNKEDGVHVFITRNQATRAWARHCRRRHMTGCHKTRDPKAHPSDADSDTDSDTEPPHARACRQLAAGAKHGQTTVGVKEEKKSVKRPSTARAASVPVKCAAQGAAHTPAPKDDDLFKSDFSTDVPLAKTLAASRAASRATSRARSALSALEEDEDVPMPAAIAIPAAAPDSPTVSSVSSLSTTSASLSAFSSISGPPRARAAAGPSALSQHLLFNRKTLVLYDDAKTTVAERKVGESMEVVDAGQVPSWVTTLGTSANMLYNRRTRILYDDLNAAVEERKPGESMQVVEPEEVMEWISTLGR
ncbi:hypothetical protein B0H14DRAFT_3502703 [Mycena olivaceomarginata]|nr:hypothetical protein B0H14DRAFT_3502703 [Mycena olivaceomarginata]